MVPYIMKYLPAILLGVEVRVLLVVPACLLEVEVWLLQKVVVVWAPVEVPALMQLWVVVVLKWMPVGVASEYLLEVDVLPYEDLEVVLALHFEPEFGFASVVWI